MRLDSGSPAAEAGGQSKSEATAASGLQAERSYKLCNFELLLRVQFSFNSRETVTNGSLL